jgi:hypothetical protein
LKKRTKKLFRPGAGLARAQSGQSLFASFSSEKEDSFLPFPRPRPMR